MPGARAYRQCVTHEVDNKHWRTYLRRALGGACPRCGGRTLFASRFRLSGSCSTCGLVFRREQGAMTGQMYLTAAITQLVAALLIAAIWLFTDWSAWVSIGVSVPILLLFSYWLLPRSMAAWVAIEFMTDIGNREPWVEE